MKKYKWDSPLEWLIDKVKEMDENELRQEIIFIASGYLDYDTIQDIYQSDMDKDGYFDKIGEEK